MLIHHSFALNAKYHFQRKHCIKSIRKYILPANPANSFPVNIVRNRTTASQPWKCTSAPTHCRVSARNAGNPSRGRGCCKVTCGHTVEKSPLPAHIVPEALLINPTCVHIYRHTCKIRNIHVLVVANHSLAWVSCPSTRRRGARDYRQEMRSVLKLWLDFLLDKLELNLRG